MVDCYVGEVRLFVGPYPPAGWNVCDGSALGVSAYPALFALIGTTYGGDGVTTFKLPDLRGRLPIGMGAGTGLSAHTLGTNGGAETVTLVTANTPAHTHTLETAGAAATTPTPGNGVTFANTASPTFMYVKDGLPAGAETPVNPVTGTISSTGGTVSHNNIMPGIALNYIIALNGIYPSRP